VVEFDICQVIPVAESLVRFNIASNIRCTFAGSREWKKSEKEVETIIFIFLLSRKVARAIPD
jgi:hypothetical protein